ncbi:interleukin-like EMT inducer domain-containing protein [Phormidium sp. CCY1219]|uniref:interleukin-like EMT inducer domain-containing protein n=1 Tax=Phormidium sp. CCY1219 TaxID=2886104 RepID=UPI002D1F6545|nr:interleukin-like EMT inducer domain-containing protein [Phormidium sp. CCY1219]MEB3827231.1 hypothetical protein [Phormidium sp. CCY1219]
MNDITIKVESGGKNSGINPRISINDREIGYDRYGRGINIVAIDPQRGQPRCATTFDTFAEADASEALIEFIERLPNETIVALAVGDEGNYSFSNEAKQACQAIGCFKMWYLQLQGSWAAIGQKGTDPGSATEEIDPGAIALTRTFPIPELAPNKGMISVTSGGGDRASQTQILHNGQPVTPAGGYQRGLNVAIFDENQATVESVHHFDLLANPGNADAFAERIENLPEGRLVAIVASDEASFNMSERAQKACESLGSRLVRKLEFRGEWAIVGYKGATPGLASENLSNKGAEWGCPPVGVQFWIPGTGSVPATSPANTVLGSITGMKLEQKLQPPDLGEQNWFGIGVDISGDWAIVGAPKADASSEKPKAGAAYLFHWENGQWQQKQKLQPSEVKSEAQFGRAVAISGDWALVGAYRADAAGEDDAGAAYLFHLENGQWQQKQKLQPNGLKAGDGFGKSVAISDRWAVVSAPGADLPNAQNAGTAYIYALINGEWQARAQVQAVDASPDLKFGYSVGISHDWAIFGTDRSGEFGGAYTFKCENGQWQQVQKLNLSEKASQFYNLSVGICGNWVILGSANSGESAKRNGLAHLFQWENGQWVHKQTLQPPDVTSDFLFFGYAVAIADNWAVVGATAPNTGGMASIFQLENGQWQHKQQVQPTEAKPKDYFSDSVAISGDRFIVGAGSAEAPGRPQAGAAYVYQAQV